MNRGFLLPVAGLWLLAAVPLVRAQCFETEKQHFLPADPSSDVGTRLAMDGETAVAGAPEYRQDQGVVWVFRRVDSRWVQSQRIDPPDPVPGVIQYFGISVALSGDVLVVGASGRGDGEGAVCVYREVGSVWMLETELMVPGSSGFGSSVDIEGNTIVVGARFENSFTGAAYVFEYTGTSWMQTQRLAPFDGARDGQLGISAALDGDVLVLGSWTDSTVDTLAGSAYVYRWNGTRWVDEQKLVAPDGQRFDLFGIHVTVSDDVLAVAAFLGDFSLDDSGAAYVFRFDGTTWNFEQKLVDGGGPAGAHSARVKLLRNDFLVVGFPTTEAVASGTGMAITYRARGNQWQEIARLVGTGTPTRVGTAIALSEDTMLIGASYSLNPYGSVYAFDRRELALDIVPRAVGAGDALRFTTCGALPSGNVLLALVDLNGVGLFLPLIHARADATGSWTLNTTVPPGLSGLDALFLAGGQTDLGQFRVSLLEQLTFL